MSRLSPSDPGTTWGGSPFVQTMSYEIIIKERRAVKRTIDGEWGVVGTKEVPREERFYGAETNGPKTRIEEVRGRLPDVEKTVVEEFEILKQRVDKLDLAAVIKAVNNL